MDIMFQEINRGRKMKRDELIKLVKNMTLYEKVSQLLQITADFYSEYAEERTGPLSDMGITEDDLYGVGSVLGISGASESIRIQKEYLKKNSPIVFRRIYKEWDSE